MELSGASDWRAYLEVDDPAASMPPVPVLLPEWVERELALRARRRRLTLRVLPCLMLPGLLALAVAHGSWLSDHLLFPAPRIVLSSEQLAAQLHARNIGPDKPSIGAAGPEGTDFHFGQQFDPPPQSTVTRWSESRLPFADSYTFRETNALPRSHDSSNKVPRGGPRSGLPLADNG